MSYPSLDMETMRVKDVKLSKIVHAYQIVHAPALKRRDTLMLSISIRSLHPNDHHFLRVIMNDPS